MMLGLLDSLEHQENALATGAAAAEAGARVGVGGVGPGKGKGTGHVPLQASLQLNTWGLPGRGNVRAAAPPPRRHCSSALCRSVPCPILTGWIEISPLRLFVFALGTPS